MAKKKLKLTKIEELQWKVRGLEADYNASEEKSIKLKNLVSFHKSISAVQLKEIDKLTNCISNLRARLKELYDAGFCLGCSDEFQDSSCGDCNRELEVRRKRNRNFKELKERADELVEDVEINLKKPLEIEDE